MNTLVAVSVASLMSAIGFQMKISVENYEALYTNQEMQSFQQTESLTNFEYVVKGSGVLHFLNKTESKSDASVPGIENPGHSFMSLELVNGVPYARFDIQIIKGTEESRRVIDVNYSSESRLIEGSWDDYLGGRDVVLEFTEAGQQEMDRSLKVVFEGLVQSNIDRLEQKYGLNLKSLSIGQIKSLGMTKIQGNNRQMRMIGPKILLDATFEADLKK